MDDIVPLRHCNKCGNDWPPTFEYFFADARTGHGFRAPCKQCIKDYRNTVNKVSVQTSRKKHYAANSEKIKQYVHEWQLEHKDEIRETRRRHYVLHRHEHLQRSRNYRAQHREERRAYDRQYRALHIEEHRVAKRIYYREQYAIHPEKFRQKSRRGYVRYQEARRQYGRRYHHLHRERRLLYSRQYDATHKEEKRQYQTLHKEERLLYFRRYRESHREETRAIVRQRRVRRKAIPGTLTPEQVALKMRLQHFRCYYCFTQFEQINGKYIYHIDHTIPIARVEAGPRHDMSFTVLTCPTCNHRKNAKLPHEWPEGGRLL